MAAEVGKALVDANPLLAEDVRPDPDEQLLDRVARADLHLFLLLGRSPACRSARRARRLTFPFCVSGIPVMVTNEVGTMYDGKRSSR